MKTLTKTSHASGNSFQKGFALVVALSVMAFIFLLIVGISSVSMVEQKTSDARKNESLARKSAMLGMKVAMAKLQKYAGPDQRVTARADILEEYAGGFDFDDQSVVNPYYTLVWDVSGSEGNKPGEEAEHDIYLKPVALVSGNDEGKNLIDEQSSLRGDRDAVWIVGSDRSDQQVNDTLNRYKQDLVDVIVKRETISSGNGQNAHYAWWVGDEGIKARINLKPSPEQQEPYEWTTLQRHGIQVLSEFSDLETEGLSKAFTMKSLQLVNSAEPLDEQVLAENYHNLTANSKGVLVDVKNGRLKQDLTFGLDKKNEAPTGLADSEYIIERWNPSKEGDERFNIQYCQWGVLRDYYNLKSDGAVNARPHMYEDTYGITMSPVITRIQHGLYVDRDENTKKAIIYHMPAVVLWNPYNVDLICGEMNLYSYIRGMNRLGEGGKSVKLMIDRDREGHDLIISAYTIHPVTIPAGESMIFSPRGDSLSTYDYYESPTGKDGTFADGKNILAPGWRAGAAFIENTKIDLQKNKEREKFWVKLRLDGSWPYWHVGLQYLSDVEGSGSSARIRERAVMISSFNPKNYSTGSMSSITRYRLNVEPGYEASKLLFSSAMGFSATSYDFSSSKDEGPVQWCGNFNPRACANGPLDPVLAQNVANQPSPAGYFSGYKNGPAAEVNYEILGDGKRGFVGNSPFLGSYQASLFEIQKTQHRLTSLAQLGHAQITGIDNEHSHVNSSDPGYDEYLRSGGIGDGLAPAYAIGSALAPAYLPLDKHFEFTDGLYGYHWHRMITWDYSYLLNDALFDKYFFSTVPQEGKFDKSKPLPNGLLEVYALSGYDEDSLKDFDEAAGQLMLNGAFNVNSTSVNAWAAFLGSMRGVEVNTENGKESSEVHTPFVRLSEPFEGPIDNVDLSPDNDAVVKGYRQLSDYQILDLAEKIVEQVKLRGPFPSMSAFVNRTLEGSSGIYKKDILSMDVGNPHDMYSNSLTVGKYMALKGALEGALERAEANEGFYQDEDYVVKERQKSIAIVGAIGAHTPGYLSQIDLLSRLGSAMTVRSDTFVVRSYGDYTDPITGVANSEARCEAVLQRYPNFVDDGNESWDELEQLTKENKKMGRRFRVVSFRWLGEDDV